MWPGDGVILNGLQLNGVDAFGVDWALDDVTGFGASAAVFDSDQRVQADGAWMSTAYLGPRVVAISGSINAPTPALAELARDRLVAAATITEVPLTFQWASGDRTCYVRRDAPLDPTRPMPRRFEYQMTMIGGDPNLYAGSADPGSGVITVPTGLPASAGGLTFPITFPITFTGSSTSGDVAIINPGQGGRLDLRIDGAVSLPQVVVENSDGIRVLAWNLTLGVGEFLLVDTAARRSLLQGQASRPPTIRQWPRLAPGLNTIRFRAPAYSATALLTVAARPAY